MKGMYQLICNILVSKQWLQ